MNEAQVLEYVASIKGPIAIMLIGVPGSGKSTLALKMSERLSNSMTVHMDNLSSKASHTDINKSWGYHMQQARRALAYGFPLIIDRTNLTVAHRFIWLNQIPSSYKIIAVDLIDIPLSVAIDRANKRETRHVPEQVITDLRSKYVPPRKADGYFKIINLEQYP